MQDLDDLTIAIIGLGLMGGSLALALQQNGVGRRIVGTDRDPAAVTAALARGAIDARCENFSEVDLIVLAMPVRAILAWLHDEGRRLSRECMVLDLGSTKSEIVAAMEEVSVPCVGGHPMCGKETAGIATADPSLFRGAKFVLTPSARTSDETLNIAQALVRRIGAQPVVMDAAAHDRAVAAISHLPYVLSANLVNALADLHDADAAALAASGYASMTRLAASDPRMMSDIVATNRANIVDMLDRYQVALAQFRAALAACDEERWGAMLRNAEEQKRNA